MLAVMSLVIYSLIGLMPGDPIDIMIFSDPEMTPAEAERLRALYGLDRPIFERYLAWLGNALSGERAYERQVAEAIAEGREPPRRSTGLEVYRAPEAAAAHKETEHYKSWRDTVAPMMAEVTTGFARHQAMAVWAMVASWARPTSSSLSTAAKPRSFI